jgi:hypothetical protein
VGKWIARKKTPPEYGESLCCFVSLRLAAEMQTLAGSVQLPSLKDLHVQDP